MVSLLCSATVNCYVGVGWVLVLLFCYFEDILFISFNITEGKSVCEPSSVNLPKMFNVVKIIMKILIY